MPVNFELWLGRTCNERRRASYRGAAWQRATVMAAIAPTRGSQPSIEELFDSLETRAFLAHTAMDAKRPAGKALQP
jgi:hypothetical protein